MLHPRTIQCPVHVDAAADEDVLANAVGADPAFKRVEAADTQ